MARMSDAVITFEIEPIVKLLCDNRECVYNAWRLQSRSLTCNLKEVRIGAGGQCARGSIPQISQPAPNHLRKILQDTAPFVGDTPVKIDVLCGGNGVHTELSLRQLRAMAREGE